MVIARADLGRRVPFGYLVEIRRRFLAQYDTNRTDFAALPPYGAAAFNGKLKDLMQEYGSTQAGRNDAMSKAQKEIDDVKGIMTENIERVLERGERIDLLVDKTDRLGGTARDFRVRSRGLRRRMWWKNVRLMALLAIVLVFLIYLLVGFGCGLPGTCPASCPILMLGSLTLSRLVQVRRPQVNISWLRVPLPAITPLIYDITIMRSILKCLNIMCACPYAHCRRVEMD